MGGWDLNPRPCNKPVGKASPPLYNLSYSALFFLNLVYFGKIYFCSFNFLIKTDEQFFVTKFIMCMSDMVFSNKSLQIFCRSQKMLQSF